MAIINPSANFTRPADTAAYASGDLVANSVAAGSVVPLQWSAGRGAGGDFEVRRARLRKSGTTVTLATFRLHFYAQLPVPANGDNAAWLTPSAGYVGAMDIDMAGALGRVFSNGAMAMGAPSVGQQINVALVSGLSLYGLLEARAAYVPASAEVFTCELELFQN